MQEGITQLFRPKAVWLVALFVMAVPLWGSPDAKAADVCLESYYFTYASDEPNTINYVDVDFHGSITRPRIQLRDNTVGERLFIGQSGTLPCDVALTKSRCDFSGDKRTVDCRVPCVCTKFDFKLGEGSDTITLVNPSPPIVFRMSIYGGPGDDLLPGGDMQEWIFGDGGNDRLLGGDKADRLSGGSGSDVVSYADHTAGVAVTLPTTGTSLDNGNSSDVGGNLGFPDELTGDVILDDVENIDGSPAIDSLVGNASANRLDGGGGGDTIFGWQGSDILTGGAGPDLLLGMHGNDLYAENGNGDVDTIWDEPYGVGDGDDMILTLDGVSDQVDCGTHDTRDLLLSIDTGGVADSTVNC